MTLSEFRIGTHFYTRHAQSETGWAKWRCTDVGTRTVCAIRVDLVRVSRMHPTRGRTTYFYDGEEAEAKGFFNGPPYGVAEHVFDEYGLPRCYPNPEELA